MRREFPAEGGRGSRHKGPGAGGLKEMEDGKGGQRGVCEGKSELRRTSREKQEKKLDKRKVMEVRAVRKCWDFMSRHGKVSSKGVVNLIFTFRK